jgi:transcription termination factor Rho
MTKAELDRKHLSELHELASAAGVKGFRALPREELVEELLSRGSAGPAGTVAEGEGGSKDERPRRGRRRRRRRGGDGESRERRPEAGDEDDERRPRRGRGGDGGEEPEAQPVTGVLDILPQGHGFLRVEGSGDEGEDVYVSASQIRRCELRPGDEVSGPARPPRRGERHTALVRVEAVNGEEPSDDRSDAFDRLTPIAPHRRIPLQPEGDDVLVRAADLLAPLAFGQRVLIRAAPRSGRTTLLRALAKAIAAAPEAPVLVVLLVDERPEEVTEWNRQVSEAEIVAAPADLEPAEQSRLAEMALSRARRRAEAGEDVVFVVDSLTRLGVAYRDPARVKPVFGAGRELEEEGSGSLTVIATVLSGTDDGDEAEQAVATTESSTLALDPDLAAAGVVPALDAARSAVSNEESLRSAEELEAARALRGELRELEPRQAAELLAERARSETR